MINALSDQVIFLRDFNSKHKQFGCVKPNKSGQMLVNIAKDLKLFYVPMWTKQTYAWWPCSWHIWHFRHFFLIPCSKFLRYFIQRSWWSHGQWSLSHPNFTWQATQTKHATYWTTLPIWQKDRLTTERQSNQHWHWYNHARRTGGTCSHLMWQTHDGSQCIHT